MARARNIKPGFFTNERLAECDPLARLLFAGLWCFADREGRLEDRPKRLRAEILPYDESCDIEKLLGQLVGGGFIVRYEAKGERFIQVLTFVEHQNPHHMEAPSDIPPPAGQKNVYNHTPISPKQRARIYARDGHKCVLCQSTQHLQIDHIKMVTHGGTSNDDNLRTLCAHCNNKRSKRRPKADQTLREVPDGRTNPAESLSLDSLSPDSSSEAIASAPAARAPTRPIDLKRQLWDTGKAYLATHGIATGKAGGLLGHWRKDHSDEVVLAALAAAEAEAAQDVVAFIEGFLRKKNGRGKNAGPATGIADGFAAALKRERDEDCGGDQPPAGPLLGRP